jgi:Ca-activated chloride channel family protein
MQTTHADLRAGRRHDVAVEFVSRRSLDCEGGRVHRLLVADRTGDRFAALVAPTADPLYDLGTGRTYRIWGLLACTPGDCHTADRSTRRPRDSLREAAAVDATHGAVVRAAERLDLDRTFGVVDERTVVECPGGGAGGVPACRGARPDHSSATSSRPPDAMAGVPDVLARVARGRTPRPTAITDASLFHGHRFDGCTGVPSGGTFDVGFGTVASDHPVTGATETHVAVRLDAGLPPEAFARPLLDLAMVVDAGAAPEDSGAAVVEPRTRLRAATTTLAAIQGHLRPDDRIGLTVAGGGATTDVPPRAAQSLDPLRRLVPGAPDGGPADLVCAVEDAVESLADGDTTGQVERQVVCLTDARAATRQADALAEAFARAAVDGVHGTVVVHGPDATALREALAGVRGAKVHVLNVARGVTRPFDYAATPLVDDLTVSVDTPCASVSAVGGPALASATGDHVHLGTVFPVPAGQPSPDSPLLVRLDGASNLDELDVTASWTERRGGEHTARVTLSVPDPSASVSGDVASAVALRRCARALRAWSRDVHDRFDGDDPPLLVPESHRRRFATLRRALAETASPSDARSRTLDLLDALCESPTPSAEPAP